MYLNLYYKQSLSNTPELRKRNMDAASHYFDRSAERCIVVRRLRFSGQVGKLQLADQEREGGQADIHISGFPARFGFDPASGVAMKDDNNTGTRKAYLLTPHHADRMTGSPASAALSAARADLPCNRPVAMMLAAAA